MVRPISITYHTYNLPMTAVFKIQRLDIDFILLLLLQGHPHIICPPLGLANDCKTQYFTQNVFFLCLFTSQSLLQILISRSHTFPSHYLLSRLRAPICSSSLTWAIFLYHLTTRAKCVYLITPDIVSRKVVFFHMLTWKWNVCCKVECQNYSEERRLFLERTGIK